mgnify:CR=1 FL=1
MQNIQTLPELFKRDTKGKVRTLTIQYGYDSNDVAGIRSISGITDGKKITSVWNMSAPAGVQSKQLGYTVKYLKNMNVSVSRYRCRERYKL